MSVLICKNISSEGPGTIEEYLSLERIAYKIIDLSLGEKLPDIVQHDTLVILGGPMSVNDDLQYIRREEILVRDFAEKGKRMLGICLGAQIMAKALGARVYKGPMPEIGWYDITLSAEGAANPLMGVLAFNDKTADACKVFKAFHWHGETFDIPVGAVPLASSALYPNQAFKYGQDAYALQFHIEVSEQIIYDWMSGENIDMHRLRAETDQHYDAYRKGAFLFYEKFFGQSTK